MKSINFLAIFVLVLSALLILPAFSAIVSVDSAAVDSMTGAAHATVCSVYFGNRTAALNNALGPLCEANFTMWFDMAAYANLTITNFRIKHAFSIPSGGSGWTATGANYSKPSVIGLFDTGHYLNTYQATLYPSSCVATNATGGVLFEPNYFTANKSFTDFNCSATMDKRHLVVTWAGNYSGDNANLVTDGRGTSVFGHNWGILEFDTENITGGHIVTDATDFSGTSTIVSARFTFYGCGANATNYSCVTALALPNGTVAATDAELGGPWNYSCSSAVPLVSAYHQIPDNPAVNPQPLGLWQILTECDQDGNASLATFSPSVWFDTTANVTPTTTISSAGLTALAFTHASEEAVAYWTPWISSHGSLILGLFFALIVLVIFLVLSAEFNMPILATAGVIIAAFIALVTLILTSPAGLLILIVLVLLLLVIGAFAIFKGMSA